jgi:hypothetical protein
VHVQVEDDLSGPPAAVNDQAVARLNFVQLSHAPGCKNHLGSDAGRRFVQGIKRVDMGSGDDQQVNGSIGVNVTKSDKILIFIDNLGWHLTVDDLAKGAVHLLATPFPSPTLTS